jgi:hypothetical protein
MEILNVIVTSDDSGLDRIDSFSKENVKQAEKLFVELVLHYSDVEDLTSEAADLVREDAEQFIDDGCYEFKDSEEGYCVWLSWTTI